MTSARADGLLALKESRALLPLWLASAVAMGAAIAAGGAGGLLFLGGLSAFALGSAGLGAYSVGHEYAHGTLGVLLAQPCARSRLLLAKAVVLVPSLAGLALLAWVMLLGVPWAPAAPQSLTKTVLLLPPLLGLCVAPWLTMVCRSAVAGVVFTLAIPTAFWTAGQVTQAAAYGMVEVPFGDGLDFLSLWTGTLVASAVGLVAGQRMFFTLEAIDSSREMALSGLLQRWVPRAGKAAGRRRRRHPLVALVGKEIRLQQPTFIVASLYLLAWAGIAIAGLSSVAVEGFLAITVLYGGLIALLAGAVASAEERAFGTLASQVLQPVAAWKQWAVKVSTAFALTVVLAIVLPLALERTHPVIGETPVNWMLVGLSLVLTSSSLYVSSLCTGGLRAALLSMSFVAVAVPTFRVIASASYRAGSSLTSPLLAAASANWTRPLVLMTETDIDWWMATRSGLPVAVVSGLIVLALRLAASNHRSAEGGRTRATRQIVALAACTAIGAAIAGAVPPLLLWILATH